MFWREEFVVDNMTMKNGYVVSDHVFMIKYLSIVNVTKEIKFTFEKTTELLENENEVFSFDN